MVIRNSNNKKRDAKPTITDSARSIPGRSKAEQITKLCQSPSNDSKVINEAN